MLSYNDAYKIIKDEFEKLNFEKEDILLLHSVGRFLAEDVISDIDMPPFNHSAMDGFAMIYDKNHTSWNIIGEIAAGSSSEFDIKPGSCVSIMTGARLPQKADTVIPIEDVFVDNNKITLKSGITLKKSWNVRLKAEDLKKGATVLKARTKIESHHISILASCGKRIVKVFKQLKIGVLATGDELIDIDFIPERDQIRASNLYSLISEVNEINLTPVNLGIIEDNELALKSKIEYALNKDIDILVTSGAVSVGKFDFLREILSEIGTEELFWKVYIKPGKPLLFSKYNKNGRTILIFSLPGNPVSSFTNFRIFVKRVIEDVLGNIQPFYFSAILDETIKKKDEKRHYLRSYAFLDNETQTMYVRKAGGQSSGNMNGLKEANCFIIFEEDFYVKQKGESVICMKI